MASNLGPYQLRSELGRGAMAVVWRAYDPSLEREVALKEPRLPDGLDSVAAAEFGARFVREAKAAAKLNHPNIVTIHAADIYDGHPVIVMELIEGETLREVLERGPLSPPSAISILDQLLQAVAYAHVRGIVHRDIKPDNVFLTPDGRVKLADFGIASLGETSTLTQAGTIMGTPGYMAPEQVVGAPVDARADIFSVGVLSYEMLTGRNPFGASEGLPTTSVMYKIVHEAPAEIPPLVLQSLPVDLRPVLGAALAKDPQNRFPSAEAFRAALAGAAIQTGGPAPAYAPTAGYYPYGQPAAGLAQSRPHRRSTWPIYAGIGAVAVVVLVVLLVLAKTGPSPMSAGASPTAATFAEATTATAGETTTTADYTTTTAAPASLVPAGEPVDLATRSVFGGVTATNMCSPDSGITYEPHHLIDYDYLTSWATDYGPGESVTFNFTQPVLVTEIRMVSGYQKVVGWDRWYANNRLRKIRVVYQDGHSVDFSIPDQKGLQSFYLGYDQPTAWIRVEVLQIWNAQNVEGHQYNDLHVSEIHPFGYTD